MSSASGIASSASHLSLSAESQDNFSWEASRLSRSQEGTNVEEYRGPNGIRKKRKTGKEGNEGQGDEGKEGRCMRKRRTGMGTEAKPPVSPEKSASSLLPEATLRRTDNQSILTALHALESKGSVRQDYPLGTPLWAYISTAYFTEASVLRPDSLRFQEIGELGSDWCSAETRFETEYEGLEGYWEGQLQDCRDRSEVLLQELRDRVGEACQAHWSLPLVDSIKQLRRKREDEAGWMGLIHSKYLYALISSVQSPHPRPPPAPTSEPDSDIYCDICLDGISTLEDPIVLCSKCDLAVHMTCFGLSELPEDDWYCEECLYGNNCQVICSICGKGSGALKRGTTKPIGNTGWGHVYCADNMPGSCYALQETKANIDLSRVDVRRCALKCQICGEKTGACVQCTYRNCLSAFHPFCWKAEFLTPNDPDESTFTCFKHTSIALPDRQDRLDRLHFQALQLLFRAVTSAPMPVLRPSLPKCSDSDRSALRKLVKKAVDGYNYREKVVGFRVILNAASRTAEIRTPTHWSSLSPVLFRRDQLSIAPHTPEASAQLYESAYQQLRKRGKRGRAELKLETAELLEKEYQRTVEVRKRRRQKMTVVRFPLSWVSA